MGYSHERILGFRKGSLDRARISRRVHRSNIAIQNINTQQIIYMPAIFAAKAAVLLQLQSIFAKVRPSARWWIINILLVLNALFFTILFFLEIFECTPRKKIWEPTIDGTCINIERTFVATGSINVLDDLLILFLPLFWVWQLRTSTKNKVGIVFVFAAGIL